MVSRGQVIRDRSDMLCLTDMWKAAGEDVNKQPAKWREHASVLLKRENEVFQTHRGGKDWAHWQIAMAYGKYLSPEFHAWCNTVVRQHMTREVGG